MTSTPNVHASVSQLDSAPAPIGTSSALRKLLVLVERVAPTDHALLLSGPTGSGKEVVAQLIHRQGQREKLPFIDINCGAIPEHLVESELFGHVRGAFTGAIGDKPGQFELAGHGSLFLDEIGELPLGLQSKLLRVLETRSFRPVGASTARRFHGRVIAATHRDLQELVREGKFREDLYYRLAVFLVPVPGLEQRREDIPLLVRHFCTQMHPAPRFSDQALELLACQNWPGNVRQLRNLVQRVAVLCDAPEITPQVLEPFLAPAAPTGMPVELLADALLRSDVPNKLEAAERLLIERALHMAGGSKTGAAALLGVNRKVVERRVRTREHNRVEALNLLDQANGLVEQAAFTQAVQLLRHGLSILDDADTEARGVRFAFHRLLAVCYRSVYGWLSTQSQQEQEAALAAGQGVVDAHDLNLLLFGIWSTKLMTLQLASARATAQDMIERACSTDGAISDEAHVASANTMFWLGDSCEVLACLGRGRLPGREGGKRSGAQGFDLVALAETLDGLASFQLGAFGRAQQMRTRLLARSRNTKQNAFDRAIALQGAAWLASLFDDHQALGPVAQELEDLGRVHGFAFYRGIGQIFRGCHLAATGELARGMEDMREGYEVHVLNNGGKLFHSFQAWKRGAALLNAGCPKECDALISTAIDTAIEKHERAYLSEMLAVGGLARAALGDEEGAEEGLRSALSTAVALGSVPGRLHAAVHLARLLVHQGRRAAAVSLLEKHTIHVERDVPFPGFDRAEHLLKALLNPGLHNDLTGEIEHGYAT